MADFSIEGIDHIEIFVKDRAKASKWYEEIFGFQIIRELKFWSENNGPLFVGDLNNDIKIALFEGSKDNNSSINRIAFRTSGEKFVDFINRLDNMELFFLKDKVTKKKIVDHDLSYSIYFDDPDGNKLELTCYDHDFVKSKI
ncbi:MAG: VOC family protein [Nitrosopumilus sp.]|nr:VOC family protein [Nitrosopumilus sp.]